MRSGGLHSPCKLIDTWFDTARNKELSYSLKFMVILTSTREEEGCKALASGLMFQICSIRNNVIVVLIFIGRQEALTAAGARSLKCSAMIPPDLVIRPEYIHL